VRLVTEQVGTVASLPAPIAAVSLTQSADIVHCAQQRLPRSSSILCRLKIWVAQSLCNGVPTTTEHHMQKYNDMRIDSGTSTAVQRFSGSNLSISLTWPNGSGLRQRSFNMRSARISGCRTQQRTNKYS
jgi:hypothetical protein